MSEASSPPDWDELGDQLAARSIADGDPTGWFDRLYEAGAAGAVSMPWNRRTPHPLLTPWLPGLDGRGRRAVVVGCGLGADAEHIAARGYHTVAFDISETAIRAARRRYPNSVVQYQTADLLDLPAAWMRTFDLVVEVITVQALPDPPRRAAIVNVGRLVAAGGTLLVIAARRDPGGTDATGPPWPLTREEIDAFATDGLDSVRIEQVADRRDSDNTRWRAEFRRPD